MGARSNPSAVTHTSAPYPASTSTGIINSPRTLLEAVALVARVILLFLGDWRAAVIPLLAV
ncbi:MAG: efflux RND transporter permease subunit, partial [Gemmataceae bacterium]